MIVELFGPPGAGKTTFAHALERRLREEGYVVETVFSDRPAEKAMSSGAIVSHGRMSSFFRRLMRPEIFKVVRDPGIWNEASARLIALNPPASMVWRLRLSQYLTRLYRFWPRASDAEHVVLFDQGYIQLICSLILLGSKKADEEVWEKLLDAVPRSHLLISLEAPRGILEQRLRERFRLQHPIERLLELDLKTNLDSIHVIARLCEMLRKREREVISISSLDPASLSQGLAIIQQRVDEMSRTHQKADQKLALGGAQCSN
jgi:deoxyadenosine/deoxycytidine kinase